MAYASAYADIHAALRTALARTGVHTGGSAGFPRVELHTFIEGSALDKQGSYRILSATIESLSVVSPDEAAQMNSDNLSVLASFTYRGNVFEVFGIVPTQMTQTSETIDGKAVYRVIQQVDIHIQTI